MEAKKISFGFSKINKKPSLLPAKKNETEENKIELIKCLEGHEIKLVEEKKEAAPLVIPLRGDNLTPAALASLRKRKAILLGEEEVTPLEEEKNGENVNGKTPEENGDENNLEKRAAKELLASLQAQQEEIVDANLVVPVVKPDDLPLDGAKESKMQDYENIPIEQFGLAMLRGMGWVEPPKKKGPPTDDRPTVRPKGMGLGADKAIKPQPLLIPPERNEVLEIKKQAYIRILAGKHKDLYGQIEGFDDDSSRIIVKMAIGGQRNTFNMFLCQPISKKEYAEYGKCINNSKYEEYKRLETEKEQIKDERKPSIKKEIKDERYQDRKPYKEEKYYDRKPLKEEEKYKSSDRYKEDYRDRDYKHESSRSNDYYKDRRDDTKGHSDYYDSKRRDERDVERRRDREDPRELSRSTYRDSHPSSSRRKSRTPPPKPSSSDDSSSSEDSDSAYERQKKKSKHKKSSKAKSKKSKSKHRKESSSDEESSSSFSSSEEERKKKKSKKNKKTKKTKRLRSRSRSRGRR